MTISTPREALEAAAKVAHDLALQSGDDITKGAAICIEQAIRAIPVAEPEPVDELRARMRMIVSHATGGSSQDIDQSVNDICCEITRNRNLIYEAGKALATPATDARLVEALRKIASCESHHPDDVVAVAQAALAAAEGRG